MVMGRPAVAAMVLGVLALAVPAAGQGVEDLAASAAGGRLVFFSSQYDDSTWKAAHLIDGPAEKGWAAQNAGAHSVILAFRDQGLAELHDIIVNPYTSEAPATWATDVEVLISTTFPFRD
jgi:hypothetical protein